MLCIGEEGIETPEIVELLEKNNVIVFSTKNTNYEDGGKGIQIDKICNYFHVLIADGFNIDKLKQDYGEKYGEMIELLKKSTGDKNGLSADNQVIYCREEVFKNYNKEMFNIFNESNIKIIINVDYVHELTNINSELENYYVHICNPNNNVTRSNISKTIYTKKEYEEILNTIKSLTKDIHENDNDFVKMVKIYNTIKEYSSYVKEVDQSAKGLINGWQGDCEYYADAIYNMGRYVGVDSVNFRCGVDEEKGGHIWNYFIYEFEGVTYAIQLDGTLGDKEDDRFYSNFSGEGFDLIHNDFKYEGLSAANPIGVKTLLFSNSFLKSFFAFVNKDINIRPETFANFEKMGINFDNLIYVLDRNGKEFEGEPKLYLTAGEPVENHIDEIIKCIRGDHEITDEEQGMQQE